MIFYTKRQPLRVICEHTLYVILFTHIRLLEMFLSLCRNHVLFASYMLQLTKWVVAASYVTYTTMLNVLILCYYPQGWHQHSQSLDQLRRALPLGKPMMPPADQIHPNPGHCSNQIRSVAYAKEKKDYPLHSRLIGPASNVLS